VVGIKISTVVKSIIPLIIGLLIGAGLTKNKNVAYLIIGYIIFFVLFNLLKDKIVKVKKAEDKKTAIKEQAWETVQDFGEATLKGNERGANLFDKYYSDYIFFVNLTVFLALIYLLFKKEWLWALVCFFSLQFHMVLNQVVRIVREIKNEKK
jgi:phosphotransferase system  glucose/maltose/N-acetylglucosamine-specific IIC component